MGMYTEFVMSAEVREDTPQAVMDYLRFMVDNRDYPDAAVPDHPLFRAERWESVLTCGSAYFAPGVSMTELSELKYGDEVVTYLTVRSSVKNYHGEIEKFVDWISPYLAEDPGTFIGYSRYEEDEMPTLLFVGPPGDDQGGD